MEYRKLPHGKENEIYTIPEGVISVEGFAFGGEGNIVPVKEVIFPKGFKEIKERAFYYFGAIRTIRILGTGVNFGYQSFAYAGNFEILIINGNFGSIGSSAFYNTRLRIIYFGGTTEPSCSYIPSTVTTVNVTESYQSTTFQKYSKENAKI